MNLKSNLVEKEYINSLQFICKKSKSNKNLGIPFFAVLIFLFVISFIPKVFVSNEYSKDRAVAGFRTDVNKLWEVSMVIEASKNSDSNLNKSKFGTTGKVINTGKINQNLKRVLKKVVDSNGDGNLSEDEINALGIMSLNEDIYEKQLEILQFHNLSIDNNLKNYMVITKGKFAGTILYNGNFQFVDSNNRCYFGVELFEQL